MKYFQKNGIGEIYGYDDDQQSLIDTAISNGYTELPSLPDIPPEAITPSTVTMRQARLALLQSGHLSTINAAMAEQSEAAQIEWEYALYVERSSPLTTAMVAILGLSEVVLDALFVTASEL